MLALVFAYQYSSAIACAFHRKKPFLNPRVLNGKHRAKEPNRCVYCTNAPSRGTAFALAIRTIMLLLKSNETALRVTPPTWKHVARYVKRGGHAEISSSGKYRDISPLG